MVPKSKLGTSPTIEHKRTSLKIFSPTPHPEHVYLHFMRNDVTATPQKTHTPPPP